MDQIGYVALACAAVALLAVAAYLLRALGPADWSLFRQRPERSWPSGVQEGEPHPWDFGALDAAPQHVPGGPPDASGPDGGVAPERGATDPGGGGAAFEEAADPPDDREPSSARPPPARTRDGPPGPRRRRARP